MKKRSLILLLSVVLCLVFGGCVGEIPELEAGTEAVGGLETVTSQQEQTEKEGATIESEADESEEKKGAKESEVVKESNTETVSETENTNSSVTVPEEETVENSVWIPVNGGTKYHSRSTCSNMKNPIQVSVETAVINGYTPCSRCH